MGEGDTVQEIGTLLLKVLNMGGKRLLVTMLILYSSSDLQVELAPTSTSLLYRSSDHHLLPDSPQEVFHSDIVDNFIRALPQEIKEQLNFKSVSTFSEAVEDLGGVITNVVDFDQSLEITDTIIDNMEKEISDQLKLTSMSEDNIASDIA